MIINVINDESKWEGGKARLSLRRIPSRRPALPLRLPAGCHQRTDEEWSRLVARVGQDYIDRAVADGHLVLIPETASKPKTQKES